MSGGEAVSTAPRADGDSGAEEGGGRPRIVEGAGEKTGLGLEDVCSQGRRRGSSQADNAKSAKTERRRTAAPRGLCTSGAYLVRSAPASVTVE